jgi:hypothetical protein
VLACEPGAVLSHRSAGVLWESSAARKRRSTSVSGGGASYGRTMVDLATELTPLELERAVNDADKRDVIHVDALRTALDHYPGVPGVKPLRNLIDRLTFTLSDSELEVRFRPIARAAGLPQPLSKRWVNRYEVDFYWPQLGLVVETDGARFHRTPSAQTRDARRDRAHILAGLIPLRFTHFEVRYERAAVRDALTAVAGLLHSRGRI